MNFEEKKQHKEVTENSDASSKHLKYELKQKINYAAVETSSKNFKVSRKSSTRSSSDSIADSLS